jgi:oligosaccharide repeat unit polymerase
MIFISLIACGVVFWLANRRGMILADPYVIFSLSFLYYQFLIPISMTLSGDYNTYTLGYRVSVTPNTMNMLSFTLFAGFAAFTLGFKLVGSPLTARVWNPPAEDRRTARGDARTLLAFAGFLLAVVLIFYREELVTLFSGYEGKISVGYNASTFSWLFKEATLICAVVLNYLIFRGSRPIAVASLSIFGFLVLSVASSGKDGMVFAMLSGVCCLVRIAPRRQWLGLVLLLAASAFALIYLVPVYAVYRGGGGIVLDAGRVIGSDIYFSDALGPFAVLITLISGAVSLPAHPIFLSPLLWVPRGIWSDRPLDMAEGFAREFMIGWQPGMGMGYSPVAEGYQRYGMLGGPIVLFLTGLIFALLQAGFVRFARPGLRLALYVTISGYIAFFLNRGPMSGVFTQSLQFWLPILTVLYLILLADHIKRSQSSQRG